jgi:hypothetical protein
MTEAEWLRCSDAWPMLQFLQNTPGIRKRRLFVCACLRAVGDCLDDANSRRAVLAAEQFADGRISLEQVRAYASRGWKDGWEAVRTRTVVALLEGATTDLSIWEFLRAARDAWAQCNVVGGKKGEPLRNERWKKATAEQAVRLRDIFRNPFRPAPVIDPGWLIREGGAVRKLAEAVYDGEFDGLPVLADALTDAGCDNADILDHCRSPGPHVRGCWVVDFLLGKA